MSRTFRKLIGTVVVSTSMVLSFVMVNSPADAAARPDRSPDSSVVTAWNTIAVRTIFTENATPIPSSGLYFAFASVAVYDAVVSIEGGYRPFFYRGSAPRGASSEVAAATAAHRVLVNYFPASTANLDADLATFLTGVPDGAKKTRGQQVGEASAADLIAARVGDGRNASVTLDVVPAPGVWRPTPPAFAPMLVPWLAFVKPIALRSTNQTHLAGPRELTSAGYAREYAETKAYGAKTGSRRTATQTETALFWNANSVLQYHVSLADRINRHPMTITAGARAFALLGTGIADALIGCWDPKYHRASWRPITAINLGDTDGNPATIADPAWEPLVTTPAYPEYASGHACITGAATNTFRSLFGPRRMDLDISSSITGTTRHFNSAAALDEETQNARVWLGLHFRRAMTDGNQIGHIAAQWALTHYFQPTCRRS